MSGTRSCLLLVVLLTVSSVAFADASYFRRGDSNADGTIDLSDAIFTLQFLFTGGGTPRCADATDANDDGTMDTSDAVFTLSFKFQGGPQPPEPGSECGWDPTFDDLGCAEYTGCNQAEEAFEVIDNYAVVEGDIVVGRPWEIPMIETGGIGASEAKGGGAAHATSSFGKRWPNRLIPYVNEAPNPDRVDQAIAHWEQLTSMRFVERTSGNASQYPNFVRFKTASGCYSRVGMEGGRQDIGLTPICGRGNIIHEIGHAVGLFHEQSRPDRDQFIEVLEDNIRDGKGHNFEIREGLSCGPYNYASVMHYGRGAFAETGCGCNTIETIPPGIPIGQRNGLTAGDIWTVRLMYDPVRNPCQCAGNSATGEPPALGRPTTGLVFLTLPDVTIETLEASGSMNFPPGGGFDVPVKIVVKNRDPGPAAPFRVSIRPAQGSSATFIPSWSIHPETPVICLPRLGSYTIRGKVHFPDSLRGQSTTFSAVADSAGEVVESDETNNVSSSLSVSFPGECFMTVDNRGKPIRLCF